MLKFPLENWLLGAVMLLWIYWLWSRRELYRFAWRMPGELGWPIVGSMLSIKGVDDAFCFINRLMQKFQWRTICFWAGLYPMVLTVDPEVVEKVLSSPNMLNKSKPMYAPVNVVLLNGIIASRVEKWRNNRKVLNPIFQHKTLLGFLPIFNKASKVMIERFGAMANGEEISLKSEIHRTIIFHITMVTTMGDYLQEDETYERKLVDQFYFALKCVTYQMGLSLVYAEKIFKFYPKMQNSVKYLYKQFDRIIGMRLAKLNLHDSKGNNNLPEAETKSTPADVSYDSIRYTPSTFVDQVLQAYKKGKLSWPDVKSEMLTLFLGAFDTTTTTLYSLLVFLAMHPKVQQSLYEEIIILCVDKDTELDYEQIQQMPYLERVFNETMRLAPSIPIIGRDVVTPLKLNNQTIVPAGVQMLISIYHLHRHPAIWGPDAHIYNPDNFLPENIKEKHPYAYIPFSKGQRNCIGWRYADFLIKVILTRLVRNYEFRTSFKYEDLQFCTTASLHYVQEPKIEIIKRVD